MHRPPLPLGPLSRLPQVPSSEEKETRFVAPAERGRKQAPAVTQQQAALRKRAEEGVQAMEGAGQVSLYSFNINELYDYDLPNIRRPSDALTALANQKLRAPGSRGASKRVLPPLNAADAPAGDAADEQKDPAAEEEEGEEEGEGKLKTGDEAANFFARNGNHTPVKFVYLNRARTGDLFRPYDLTVVSREQVDAEYFTMSACGVVHVFASGLPSEFVLLSTWMQQSTFFNVLTSIRFFKHYLAAKIFRLWRANVRCRGAVEQSPPPLPSTGRLAHPPPGRGRSAPRPPGTVAARAAPQTLPAPLFENAGTSCTACSGTSSSTASSSPSPPFARRSSR